MQCPTEAELRQFCLNGNDAGLEQRIVDHLGQCQTCQAAIERFSQPLVESVASLGDHNVASDSTLLRDRLGQLKVQRPSPQRSTTPQYQDLQPWIEDGDSEIGRVGHYDLIRCIGRGGMGVVFEAFDQELQRPVALKMMSPALLTDPSNSQRFLREARAAAAINHPAVVAIHAVSKVRDLPYLVMELVDGESLQERLGSSPQLDTETIVEVAAEVADGLAAAHDRGIVHRDIKPANILLTRTNGGVKLTDFGLAYSISENSLTQTGTLLGTPEFLAPEQINGQPIDHRSDLFSLGSVIYQMCAGQPPFVGQTVVSTLREVTTSESPPLQKVSRDVPHWLSELVVRLHAKEPDERIADAATVATLLRSRGSKSLPPQKSSSNRMATGKSRNLWIVALVSIAAVAAATILFAINSGYLSPIEFAADSSAELFEYLEEHDGDLVVQLVSDEPYLLDAIEIEGRSIELVAGEFDNPLLIFRLPKQRSAFACRSGELTLRGIRIEVLEGENEFDVDHEEVDDEDEFDPEEVEDDEVDRDPVITVHDGSLVLKDCKIISPNRSCVELFGSDGYLTETFLETESIAIATEPSESNELELLSCTVNAEVAVSFSDSVWGTLTMADSEFESEYAVECVFDSEVPNGLKIDATGNRFECESLIAVYDVELLKTITPGDVPFSWTGSDNEKPEVLVTLFGNDEDEPRRVRSADWLKPQSKRE